MPKISTIESAIQLGGRSFTLRFDMRAASALEQAYGMSVDDITKLWRSTNPVTGNPRGITIEDLQRIIWAGLRRHHADVTLDGVLDLMDTLDSTEAVADLTRQTLRAYGQGHDTGEDSDDATARPRQAGEAPAT